LFEVQGTARASKVRNPNINAVILESLLLNSLVALWKGTSNEGELERLHGSGRTKVVLKDKLAQFAASLFYHRTPKTDLITSSSLKEFPGEGLVTEVDSTILRDSHVELPSTRRHPTRNQRQPGIAGELQKLLPQPGRHLAQMSGKSLAMLKGRVEAASYFRRLGLTNAVGGFLTSPPALWDFSTGTRFL